MCFDKWDMKSFCFHIKKLIVYKFKTKPLSPCLLPYPSTAQCFGVYRLGELLDLHLFFFFFLDLKLRLLLKDFVIIKVIYEPSRRFG